MKVEAKKKHPAVLVWLTSLFHSLGLSHTFRRVFRNPYFCGRKRRCCLTEGDLTTFKGLPNLGVDVFQRKKNELQQAWDHAKWLQLHRASVSSLQALISTKTNVRLCSFSDSEADEKQIYDEERRTLQTITICTASCLPPSTYFPPFCRCSCFKGTPPTFYLAHLAVSVQRLQAALTLLLLVSFRSKLNGKSDTPFRLGEIFYKPCAKKSYFMQILLNHKDAQIFQALSGCGFYF